MSNYSEALKEKIEVALKHSARVDGKLESIMKRFESEGRVWFDTYSGEWKEVDKKNPH